MLDLLQVARDLLSEQDMDEVLRRVLASARALTEARYAALNVVDENPGEAGEPIRNPDLEVPILVGGRTYANLYLTEKGGGGEFTEADEEAAILLAEFAGLAIDHARRFARSEAVRRTLERNIAALDVTVTIARTLAAQTDLDTILDLVAKQGRALVSARAVAIELRQGDRLTVVAAAGEIPQGLIGAKLDPENSVAGAALRSLRPERLETSANRARYAGFGLGRHGLAAEAGLVVPLTLRGRGYGALVAVDRQSDGPSFGIEDEELLEAFAASAATAVATAQLFTDLRPVVLDQLGVAAAIESLADQIEDPELEIQLRVDLSFEDGRAEDRLRDELESAVYRIVHEALTNTARHAEASRALVEVVEDDLRGEVRVMIEDDGVGFPPEAESDGFGLAGMREQVELLGGWIRISSSPGNGTEVRATLPSGRDSAAHGKAQ